MNDVKSCSHCIHSECFRHIAVWLSCYNRALTENTGKESVMTETMTDYDGLSMLMHTGADLLMFELNEERNPFRILCILLLIAGFKLTGMLINENMNTNHVNIIRNALIKLSESVWRLVNRANTTIPVPVKSVIAA